MNKVYHNKDIGLTVYRDTDITRNPFINKLKDLLCGIQDSNKDLQKLDGWIGVDENHYLECNGDLYYEGSINEFGFSATLKLFDCIEKNNNNKTVAAWQSNPIIVDYINYFNKQLKEHFDYKNFMLTKYWFNIHKNNSVGHPIHNHLNSVANEYITEFHNGEYYSVPILNFIKFMGISTVYYVDVSNSSAPLNFYTDDKKEIDSIDLQRGDLAIFPAHLNHGVPLKKNSDGRIMIAADVKVEI